MQKSIGIFLFNGAEVLDFAGPFEAFTTASRLCERAGKERPFNVFTFATTKKNIIAREGLEISPTFDLQNVPAMNILIIPGGVSDEPQGQEEVMEFLRQAVKNKVETVASVCTGTFILAKAGILKGLKATTHWNHTKKLKKAFPDIDVIEGVKYADQGGVLTAAGVASGITMSLYLISRIVNEALAERSLSPARQERQ